MPYKRKRPIRKAVTVLAKKCCYCWKLKPATDFYRSRKSKDGLRSECKVCGQERAYLYRLKLKVEVYE